MAELKEIVIKGPDPEKDGVVRWRCVDLRAKIASHFAVTFHKRSVAKLLRKLELTRLQPRPYHPKKDAAAQEAFKINFASLVNEALPVSRLASRWRCGSKMKPEWARRVGSRISGRRSAPGHPRCGITATIRSICLARSAPLVRSAPRSSCPPPIPRR